MLKADEALERVEAIIKEEAECLEKEAKEYCDTKINGAIELSIENKKREVEVEVPTYLSDKVWDILYSNGYKDLRYYDDDCLMRFSF